MHFIIYPLPVGNIYSFDVVLWKLTRYYFSSTFIKTYRIIIHTNPIQSVCVLVLISTFGYEREGEEANQFHIPITQTTFYYCHHNHQGIFIKIIMIITSEPFLEVQNCYLPRVQSETFNNLYVLKVAMVSLPNYVLNGLL